MKKSNKALMALLLACMSAMMVGCSENEDSRQAVSGQQITFVPTVATDWNGAVTRAAMQQNATAKVQQLTDGLYLHTVVTPGFESDRQQGRVTRGTKYTATTFDLPFQVWGYRYGHNGSITDVTSSNFFTADTVKKVNNEWIANNTFVWPAADDKTDFHAYTIYPTTGTGVTSTDAQGGLQLTVTVQENPSNQVDVLTANAVGEVLNTTLGYTVDLPFKHQLTAVQFVLDENVAPGTVKSIELVGIATTGTLHVADDSWTELNSSSLTIDLTNGNTTEGIGTTGSNGYIDTGKELVGVASPLLLIPQTFNSTQGIRVIIDTGDEQLHTLYASLCPNNQPTQWLPGTTVTYKISTSDVNVLRMGTVNYPTSWNTASTELNSIKSAYAEGDVLGVYAIDADGTVQVENRQLTKTANGWSSEALYVPGLTYFFYYPYGSTGLAHSGTKVVENETVVVTTPEDFFATGISSWAPAADQSTAAKLNAQDLQVGKGTLISASTVNLTMAHAMGLAKVSLGTQQFNTANVRYTKASTSTGNTYTLGNQTVFIKATNQVNETTDKPLWNGDAFYYVVNGSKTFQSQTGMHNEWNGSVTATVTGNEYDDTFTAYPKDNTGSYTYQGVFYSYTGTPQSFTVADDGEGTYNIECWGAQGANGTEDTPGGYGAYTSGGIKLDNSESIYLYVGGHPADLSLTGGWNGGANGKDSSQKGCAGGGATDVRLTNGDWNAFASLASRIMVAAAGGGSGSRPDTPGATPTGHGGPAGGLVGYDGIDPSESWGPSCFCGLGATQTEGGNFSKLNEYIQGTQYLSEVNGIRASNSNKGGFGYGGYDNSTTCGGPGGGSGYYGGGAGNRYHSGGGGGSSFISGHSGCDAINAPSGTNYTHSGSPNHYSGRVFTGTVMIDGKGKQWTSGTAGSTVNVPKTNESGTQSTGGHVGAGYARITLPIPVSN